MIRKILSTTILGSLTLNDFIEKEMSNSDIKIYEPVDNISIVIPVYNEERFIEKTLKSLRDQTIIQHYPDYFELILVNNNSTDNSLKLAEPYVDNIINVTTRGKLYARNQGIKQSNSNIIVAADADVYYPPFWLNTLLEPFNNTKNQNFSNLSGTTGSVYNPEIPGIPVQLYNTGQFINKYLVHPNSMSGSNSAFWKHKYYQVGKFNEQFNQMSIKEMHNEEENKFGKKLSKLGRIIYKLNACCVHLGGERTGCRIGITDIKYCENQGIGIQRFG